jgi:FkbM family methyltransferase
MVLKTKSKIALASMAYRAVAGGRRILGKQNWTVVERSDIRWQLDLSEGIDFSIYLLGAFERPTVAAFDKLVRPGSVIFDIGANVGAHTLQLAKRAAPNGRVFAFEPADFAFEKLRKNLALNPDLEKLTCAYQILLSCENAPLPKPEIYASWPLRGRGQVHAKHRGRLVPTRKAAVDTLDNFVKRERIERLDLIKIDVDGHESQVLAGGVQTLTRFRPVLLLEISPYVHSKERNDFATLIALLQNLSYEFEDVDTGKALPLNAKDLEELIPDGSSINAVGHPNTADRPRD